MPTATVEPALLALPILSGIAFAIVGVAYRRGQQRGVPAMHVVFHMGIWGALFFLIEGEAVQWREAPALIFGVGLAAGLTQWATAFLIGVTLQLGPLSPMWCALNLTFVPVTLYSAFAFDESVSGIKLLGLALAVASVVLASMRVREPREEVPRRVTAPIYGLLLVALLLVNSVMHASIKHLGTVLLPSGETAMDGFRPVFFVCVYLAMIIPIGIEHAMRRDGRAFTKSGWVCGGLAGLGSIGGVGFLALSAHLPGAVVFTLSAVFSLLGGTLASVLFFGECATPSWWAMMICAVAAVVLVSL
jgi:drug/metabolite transporter (DMT)-like permease